MKTERSFPAIKAAAVLMTLVLSAGPVTACTEKPTVNTDNTTQITDDQRKIPAVKQKQHITEAEDSLLTIRLR